MIISQEDMRTALNELDCRTNFTISNVTEYMLPKLKEPVYLHIDSNTPVLIIRPAFEVFSGELATLDGVHAQYDYHHNAQMTRFPTRRHKSLKESHYGLAFKFETAESVKLFITRLIEIVKG
ncbi:hypothetical protein BCU94_08900 [Shewanella sp. 10N.286.52.C2]|nr:hypothetical protein BCU94_08900 [Shewanella sp. 10N.286.52.C2]PMG39294.1 hypothetical protein BCU91_15445 [Shewanella sp. 10N.286.52.B9]PMH87446.1 hypothetical protein BCU57_07180 [Shewanella sp. 10N.286.48.B5]PMI03532.1 hypothetical protein BCU55_00290 [Shewanella sp. 10N.286.48.A6]